MGTYGRSLTPQICRIKKARDVSYGQKTFRTSFSISRRPGIHQKVRKKLQDQESIRCTAKWFANFSFPSLYSRCSNYFSISSFHKNIWDTTIKGREVSYDPQIFEFLFLIFSIMGLFVSSFSYISCF